MKKKDERKKHFLIFVPINKEVCVERNFKNEIVFNFITITKSTRVYLNKNHF